MDTLHSDLAPEKTNSAPSSPGFFRFLVDILETLLLSMVLFVGINAISARIKVDGSSMEPTLHNGEFVIVNKLAYRFGNPTRGEIIVFHYPRDPGQEFIKRVIGLPGDQVKINNGIVYINGESIQEPYIAASPSYTGGEWTVPGHQLFVLGDNRNSSSDSHEWGFVPMEYVVGKAIFVYWPIQEWGIIHHVPLASAAP